MERILLNRIRTPDGTILESKDVHDYQTHLDKNGKEYMVDGGREYLRRTIHPDAPYKELSIYDTDAHSIKRTEVKWGRRMDKNHKLLFKTEYIPIKDLDTNHIEAIIGEGHVKEGTPYYNLMFDELVWRSLYG